MHNMYFHVYTVIVETCTVYTCLYVACLLILFMCVDSLTVTSPCVVYMLRDMEIMEDLYDIRRVSCRCH